jgi:acetyl esterase
MDSSFSLPSLTASRVWRKAVGFSVLCLAAAPCFPATVRILDESFLSGQRLTQNLPATSAWYGSDGNLSEISGGVRLTLPSGSAHVLTYFTDAGSVSIAEGEVLRVTYRFRLEGVKGGGSAIRLGVFNSGASRVAADNQGTANGAFEGLKGYGVFFNPDTSNANGQNIRQRLNAGSQLLNATPPWSDPVTGGSALQLAETTDYTGVFSISRTGADTVLVSHRIRIGSTLLTYLEHVYSTGFLTEFNTFAIAGVGNNRPDSIALYSVNVELTEMADEEIDVPPASFAEWVFRMGLTPANAQPNADPVGAGVSNLLRYALGMTLGAVDRDRLPRWRVFEGGEGQPQRPGLSFFMSTAAEDIELRVEASNDLQSWTPSTLDWQIGPEQGGLKEVEVRDLEATPGDPPRRFYRLKVELADPSEPGDEDDRADDGAAPGTRFVYKESAGSPRHLEVFFPADWSAADTRPAILLFHGGNWQSGSLEQFRYAGNYFASRGMVAVSAEYQMIPQDQRHTVPPGVSRKEVCIIDAKSAIRWMKQNAGSLGLDPDRLVVGGGSAGGHIAFLATTNPGLNDPNDPPGISTDVVAYVLFNPAFDPGDANFPEVDAARYIHPNLAPATVFFGTEDERWLPPWETLLAQIRELEGPVVEYYLAEGRGHGFFNRPPWQDVTLIQADRFLAALGLLQGEPTLPPPPGGETLFPATAPGP